MSMKMAALDAAARIKGVKPDIFDIIYEDACRARGDCRVVGMRPLACAGYLHRMALASSSDRLS
jgi:hypothetical protein